MHPVHNTDALVLARRDDREADALFWLLTRTHGLVLARAQGVRKETSKLRYVLREFSIISVSLVRTRTHFRITGAHAKQKNTYRHRALVSVARVARLITQLQYEREVDEKLYALCEAGFTALASGEEETTAYIEALFVAQILRHLGHMRDRPEYDFLANIPAFDEASIEAARTQHRQLISDINEALAESGLVQ